MSAPVSVTTAPAPSAADRRPAERPLVSLIVPAYNEALVVATSLTTLCDYMVTLEHDYRWELIVVDDGSMDGTGELADEFARSRPQVRVIHHRTNFGLGQAIKSGLNQCRGDYVVTLDVDLSYSPEHIPALLAKLRETHAKIVIASPYTKGGSVANVPWLRRALSVWANRFLSFAANRTLSTLTGMVRAYDGRFLRGVDLKSMGMEINSEVIYKAMLLRAQIEEVPARLEWRVADGSRGRRRSSMRVLRHAMAVLTGGFLFRPFMLFVVPGLALLLVALYANSWVVLHTIEFFPDTTPSLPLHDRLSDAVAAAYREAPHAFVVGLMSLMLSVQLISLGVLALQSKRYFEETFHLGTTIYRSTRRDRFDAR